MKPPPNFLNPDIPLGLERVTIPIVKATKESLAGYGYIVNDPNEVEIEIVRWPAQGNRAVDPDSGNEGGTTEGQFISEWKGDILYGRNSAVSGHYIIGYGTEPELAVENHSRDPKNLLVWHANYHPDGGQCFFPETKKPFVVPLAMPGDEIMPYDFVCFHFSGLEGLYIHPNVWHEGVFGMSGEQRFFDKQGAVHARISIEFAREFNCLLEVSLEQFNPA